MINLAGVKTCDETIRAELVAAGIEIVSETSKPEGEVPYSLTGKLGAFTFWRAWYYWVASGPMPLDQARKLYEMTGQTVRAGGHCGATPPEEHTTWRDPVGVEIFTDPTGEEKKGWDRFLAAHPRTRSEPVLFAADPSVVPGAQQFVEGYHIDTQDGLNLFADTIRRMR